ncbi:MAG: hypothetical protein C0468_07510 [Planctomyces sp.]|nr:hypothetical protein [Planctomyces sp.]
MTRAWIRLIAGLGNAAVRAGAIACAGWAAPIWAQDAPFESAPADLGDPQAIECLATAISYEAGNEPLAGQEAVAQVVLNRVRAPDFPKSVCGVVYQGASRRTGCQFTFTCDGSLSRPRSARSLSAARLVAARVLRGGGPSLVGDALNYHADYVSPGWALGLTRVVKIGAHIFYRRPGGAGWAPGQGAAAFASAGSVTASTARPASAASPGVFAPWGLPVLRIARGGAVRAITPPSLPAQHQIGPLVDPSQRDGQAAPGAGAAAVGARLDNDRERVVDQAVTVADRR